MTAPFTPGPLVIDELDAQNKRDLGIPEAQTAFWIAEKRTAGEVVALIEHPSRPLAEANARLFVAAPEMYELLRRFIDAAEEPYYDKTYEAQDDARKLLARINGAQS